MNNRILTPQNIDPKLLYALGLPNHTKSFVLRVDAMSNVAEIECVYYPEVDGRVLAETVFKQYQLVERQS
jgi:hypothetical protein